MVDWIKIQSIFFIKCIDKQRKIIYNINKGGDNMTHEDFEEYVLYCVDEEDFPPDYEVCSCEDICKSCKFFELFGEDCPCALSITCMGYDDKGKQIVASCSSYEKRS